MKDPILDQIRHILPELYGTTEKPLKPGGMCTPESGCSPAEGSSEMDILKLLRSSDPASATRTAETGRKKTQPEPSKSTGPTADETRRD